jgi:hypothetical protein
MISILRVKSATAASTSFQAAVSDGALRIVPCAPASSHKTNASRLHPQRRACLATVDRCVLLLSLGAREHVAL